MIDFRLSAVNLRRVEGDAALLFLPHDVLDEESIGVVPGQEDVLDNSEDAFPLKAQRLGADDG